MLSALDVLAALGFWVEAHDVPWLIEPYRYLVSITALDAQRATMLAPIINEDDLNTIIDSLFVTIPAHEREAMALVFGMCAP